MQCTVWFPLIHSTEMHAGELGHVLSRTTEKHGNKHKNSAELCNRLFNMHRWLYICLFPWQQCMNMYLHKRQHCMLPTQCELTPCWGLHLSLSGSQAPPSQMGPSPDQLALDLGWSEGWCLEGVCHLAHVKMCHCQLPPRRLRENLSLFGLGGGSQHRLVWPSAEYSEASVTYQCAVESQTGIHQSPFNVYQRPQTLWRGYCLDHAL